MTELEQELIQSIRKGNSTSFELVFKTYYPKLCTFAFGYTRQLESAEDIVKDFFVKLWTDRETLNITSSLSGYLFHSVRNACINYLQRDISRNKSLSLDEIDRLGIKINEPMSQNYLLEKIYAEELESQIMIEIGRLPEGCKEIFRLSRFENLSHKEIAAKLNIAENTVKVQIYKALKRIKKAVSTGSILLFTFISKKT